MSDSSVIELFISNFPELFALILYWCGGPTQFISQFVSRQFRSAVQPRFRACKKYNLLEHAIRVGDIELISWVISLRYSHSGDEIYDAVRSGNLEILKFFFARGYTLPDSISILAAGRGHLHILKWLDEEKIAFSESHTDLIVSVNNGYFEVVKWLYEYKMSNRPDKSVGLFKDISLFRESIQSGNLEMIKWIYYNTQEDHFSIGPDYDLEFTSDVGPLNYNHTSTSEDMWIEIFEWLESAQFSFSYAAFYYAVENNYIKIMKWLYERQYPEIKSSCRFITEICDRAARCGHLDMLKWLLDNKCQYSGDITLFASGSGNIEMVKWLVSQGHKLHKSSMYEAVSSGNLELVKWLKNEYHIDKFHGAIVEPAVRCGKIEMVEWLLAEGYEFHRGLSHMAVIAGNIKMLKWLVAHGQKLDKHVMTSASFYGYLKIVKWLVKVGCPYNKKKCIKKAKPLNKNDVVNYLTRYA